MINESDVYNQEPGFQVFKKSINVTTWDDYDEHRQDFQEAGHEGRTFGVGDVLGCQNPLYNHLICTPVPGTHSEGH